MNEEFEKWMKSVPDGFDEFEYRYVWEAAWRASRKQAVEECAAICESVCERYAHCEDSEVCAKEIRALNKD